MQRVDNKTMGEDSGQQQETGSTCATDHISLPPLCEYPYQPLNTDLKEIRLFRITNAEDLIKCEVGRFALDESPVYTALSYTWSDNSGNDECNNHILLDGHAVGVRSNLEAALRELVKESLDKYLWVDALCINQTDRAEREEQVKLMGPIYSRAKIVISWLGKEHDNSQEALQTLSSFREIGFMQTLYDTSDPWAQGKPLGDDRERKLRAIIRLFTRRYWRRAWVVQEMALARNLFVRCGPDHIAWGDLQKACNAIYESRDWMTIALHGSNVFYDLPDLLNSGPWLQDNYRLREANLCNLLLFNRTKSAKEPSDMVYGILGLASEDDRLRIPIDYNLEPHVLFRNIAVLLIKEHKELRILAENKPPSLSGLSSNSSLPSWAVNWANQDMADQTTIFATHRRGTFSASGKGNAYSVIENGKVLLVKGFRIGTITRVGSLMPGTMERDFKPIFDVIYDWWLIFDSMGRNKIFGEKGFFDFLHVGQLYRHGVHSPTHVKELEVSLRQDIRTLMALYKPDDVTFTPLVGKETGAIDKESKEKAQSLAWSGSQGAWKRKLCVVDEVLCGVGPQCAEIGDLVVAVLGIEVPLVLRKRTGEDANGYINLGDAYVEGLMYGDAVKEIPETFSLY